MDVVLKILLLFSLIIIPLFPVKKKKRKEKVHKEDLADHSRYGVSEDGYLTIIDNEEDEKFKDSKHL